MVALSPAQARERVVAGNRLCADGPEVGIVDHPGRADGPPVGVRVYESGTPAATLVYAHGGGWVTGDLDYADELCRFLARDAGLRVVSVDYRLAPEHPYPAAVEDLAAAWAWAHATYPGPLALGGDSAGGNLAAAVAVRASHPASFLLLLYPVLGLPGATASYRTRETAFPIGAADMRWFFEHYLAGIVVPDPPGADLAPLHAEDLDALPPTHLVLAGHDPLHDEGAAFADAIAAAGGTVTVHDHPSLCHGFLRFTAASPAAREARSAVVAEARRLAGLPGLHADPANS